MDGEWMVGVGGGEREGVMQPTLRCTAVTVTALVEASEEMWAKSMSKSLHPVISRNSPWIACHSSARSGVGPASGT